MINHTWHGMFVSFSKAIQAFSEATLTRFAIHGDARVIEAAYIPYHA